MRGVSRHPRSSSYSGGTPWLSWFTYETFPLWHPNKTKQSTTSVGCQTSYNLLPVPGPHPSAQHMPYLYIFVTLPRYEAHREPPHASRVRSSLVSCQQWFTLLSCVISPPICLIQLSHRVCYHTSTHSKGRQFFFSFSFFPSRLLP